MVTLSQEERQKFATYLKEVAATNQKLVDQMVAIKAPAAVIKKYEVLIAAYSITANELLSIEAVTL